MKENLMCHRVEILNQVQYDTSFPRHSEFISESDEMLKRVQHDEGGCHSDTTPHHHPEFSSGSKKILKQVQYDALFSLLFKLWARKIFARTRPQLKTQFAFGRSMIEMLGVLAIIGVLSIGAIYGYKQAMNRYRMNVLTDFISSVHLASHEICLDSDECQISYSGANGLPISNGNLCHSGYLPKEACSSIGQFAYYNTLSKGMAWRVSGTHTDVAFELFVIPEAMCRSVINLPLNHLKWIRVNTRTTFTKQPDGSFKRLSDNAIVDSSTIADLCVDINNQIELRWD